MLTLTILLFTTGCVFQLVKKTVGSVRLIYEESQEEKLIPDVYLKLILAERPQVYGVYCIKMLKQPNIDTVYFNFKLIDCNS